MSQEIALQHAGALAAIKSKLSGAFASFTGGDSLADGIGASYGVVHYKGKVWSLSYAGQSYNFTRPDDGTLASYIDVVILKQAPQKSKSYFLGFDQDAAGKAPECTSLDGVRPDPDARNPQSATCAICPRNIWKVDQAGRKTKECSDYKRLAVLLMPSQTQRMMCGQPLLEPVFLRVPPASLAGLANYGKALDQAGIKYFALVTRISFDPTKPHQQFVYTALQALTAAEEPVIIPLLEDATTKRIVGAGVVNPVPQIAAPVAPPVQQRPVAPVAPPPPAQPAAPMIDLTPISTGFATTPPQFVNQPAPPVTATVTKPADVGAVIEADDLIDSRLASLMPH